MLAPPLSVAPLDGPPGMPSVRQLPGAPMHAPAQHDLPLGMPCALHADGGVRAPLRSVHWLAFALYPLLSFFSPSEAYLFEWLTELKGFTAVQLVGRVFPVWTYALFACLPLALACSRLLGHKLTVVLGAVARLSAAGIVLAVPAGCVRLMQLDQACFSFFFVAKTSVLPCLLFELLEPTQYQRAIALVRGCVLIGSASSALAAQALVSRGLALRALVRGTFWCQLGALLSSLALPSAPRAASHARGDARGAGEQDGDARLLPEPVGASPRAPGLRCGVSARQRGLGCALAAVAEVRSAVCSGAAAGSRLRVVLAWHVCLTAVQQLVLTYYQALFAAIEAHGAAAPAASLVAGPGEGGTGTGSAGAHGGGTREWNGLVLGGAYLAASLASLAAAHAPVERAVRTRTSAMAAGSSALAALLLALLGSRALSGAWALPLTWAYAMFALVHVVLEFARTASVAQLGVLLNALGCRRFLTALIGCQLGVAGAQALAQLAIQRVAADAPRQFCALAAGTAAVALAFAAAGCREGCRRRCRLSSEAAKAGALREPHVPAAPDGLRPCVDPSLNFVPAEPAEQSRASEFG